MLLPNRHGSSDDYRYGFQGQEKDDEISGEGNSYAAEFLQYDPRVARRWNPDIIVKTHESPYAAIANNPIWFSDRNGADTTKLKHLNSSIKEINRLSNELEKVGNKLKKYEQYLKKAHDLDDEHTGWSVISGFIPPIAAYVQVDYYMSDMENTIEARVAEYNTLQDEFDVLFHNYNIHKGFVKQALQSSEAIELDVVVSEKNASGGLVITTLIATAIHKNSNNAQGNYALYQIDIDGQTYKYGVADADRMTKRDINVKRPNGSTSTINAGTPVRLYQQQRVALMLYDAVEVTYDVKRNITKVNIKQLENKAIFEYMVQNGWFVPDGNSAHEKKYKKKDNAKRRGIFPKKLKR